MKTTLVRNMATLVTVSILLSACGTAAPTVDPAAIATSAVQTVEARYTADAANQPVPSETPAPTNAATPTAQAAVTPATSTPQPVDSNGKACYTAIFLEDVTIPDGMLVAPGSTFTKKWRVQNNGNCTWDQTYSLVLANGDAMGAATSVPLPVAVAPGQNVVLAVDMTAPTTNGIYTGYWRIATPFGGTFGVGFKDQSLIAEINVTDKPKRDEGVAGIDIGLYQRVPETGCNAKGAAFTISAVVRANAATTVDYYWLQHPEDDSRPQRGKLRFSAAGSQTVTFTWNLQKEAIQNIDRWVALVIDDANPMTSDKVHFTFTCDE